MKHILLSLASVLVLSVASAASAESCYADYKAKRDNPLKLHYGVVELSGPCSVAAARSEVAARLKPNGWTLLNVMSVFGKDGLKERQDSAGRYFLRF
ncbi:hypothetical protein [Thalassovita taeanensis]|uniref:DUF4177 domain-containing protein n=1 Tax=Thalassovita taeanensis TaxID=657014 RepID=A0A1H9CIF8_9RHOB|nr:hypothetical protein [Thalassovita taeanensis]SEQ00924.1 hypothetical protein SAMN04488092_103270 [Thalassovita taeanensis]